MREREISGLIPADGADLAAAELPKGRPLFGPEPATEPTTTPAPTRPETEPQIKPFTFPGEPKPAQRPDPNRTYPACEK